MNRKRTTLSLPPGLLEQARNAGLTNISEFCTRVLEAYLDGVQDTDAIASKLIEEDHMKTQLTETEINQIIRDHIESHRDEILRHLAQHGSFGRKCIDRIRVGILLDTGQEVSPAQIRPILDEVRDEAWKTGDLHLARMRLQFDREFSLYGAKIYNYIVTDEDRLAEAAHVKAEQDPGLVSLWATGVVNHFAELGITIHNPTVYRVLDTISTDQPAATPVREPQHSCSTA